MTKPSDSLGLVEITGHCLHSSNGCHLTVEFKSFFPSQCHRLIGCRFKFMKFIRLKNQQIIFLQRLKLTGYTHPPIFQNTPVGSGTHFHKLKYKYGKVLRWPNI